MKILVVRHSLLSPCGIIGQCIVNQGGYYVTVMPSEGDSLPENIDGFDGMVILGGPQNAMEDKRFPHFVPLLKMVRAFDEAEKPVLGICLGAQLLARAWGGRVYRLDRPENGFHHIQKTAAAQGDPLFATLPEDPYMMEWHDDSFDLPPGATLLMAGDECRNQAFKIGNCSYALQFHPEVTVDVIRGWVRNYHDFLSRHHPHFFKQIELQISRHMKNSFAYCRLIGNRWLVLVGEKKKERSDVPFP